MKMVFRWFGEGNDHVTLAQIRQIPGVEGIVWSLHDVPAGEEWPMDKIAAVRRAARAHGFHTEVVESVNVHESIKLGLPSRERYIANYARTLEKLGEAGVKVVCYNFMPVFDWIRTELERPLGDGSTAMCYERSKLWHADPRELVRTISANPDYTIPGWEPERLASLGEWLLAYESVTEERLWSNLQYFLERIVPVAERSGIRMAIHPDDPPWPVFGLPRIITGRSGIRRLLEAVDHPCNGVTLCSGSLGANPDNDIPGMIRQFGDRIAFVHIRNVRVYDNGDFIETSHRAADGTVDMVGIMHALREIGYTGYARPDHGRHLWGERCRPGYGLYDRAMGVMYLWGLWDALQRRRAGGIGR